VHISTSCFVTCDHRVSSREERDIIINNLKVCLLSI
jgi:hypothetical protein